METVPLHDTYLLYLHYKDLGLCYSENMEQLMEISDIVTFWQTFNNIPTAIEIFSDGYTTKKMKRNNATPCAYSFFRKNVQPCWEDLSNCTGFEYSVKSNKNLESFFNLFINSIVELLTEKNEYYKYINGIRIVDCTKNNSVMYRIEFWISDERIKPEIEIILRQNFSITYRLMYKSHKNVKETV